MGFWWESWYFSSRDGLRKRIFLLVFSGRVGGVKGVVVLCCEVLVYRKIGEGVRGNFCLLYV